MIRYESGVRQGRQDPSRLQSNQWRGKGLIEVNITPKLEIDLDAEAAYLRLADSAITSTKNVTEAVLVDLDELNMVVGIEVLDLDTAIPFSVLTDKFHVHSEQMVALRQLGRTPRSFMLNASPQGTLRTQRNDRLEFC